MPLDFIPCSCFWCKDVILCYCFQHTAPSQISQVFNIEFEKNPLHVDADFAVSLNVQPVEIVYDEVSWLYTVVPLVFVNSIRESRSMGNPQY